MSEQLSADFYEQRRDPALIVQSYMRVLPASAKHSGRRALDIGCGEGTNSVFLAANGYEVTGIDIDASELDNARRYQEAQRLGESACRFVEEDILNVEPAELDGPFDLVVITNMLHMMPKKEQYELLATAQRVTNPLGYNAISGYMVTDEITNADNRATMLYPGELQRFYRASGWRLKRAKDIPKLPNVHNGVEYVNSQSLIIAVPPLGHRPSPSLID